VNNDSSEKLHPGVWIGLVTLYVVWSSTYLAIRYALESIPPFYMAASRFLIAGIILYTWRRLRGDLPPSRRHWRSAFIVGGCLLLGGNGGVVWAEQRVASGVAALLVGSAPLWMVLLDALRTGGQRLTLRNLAGVLVGFIGVLLLAWPQEHNSSLNFLGVVVLLMAAFFWAVGSVYSRGAALPPSPLMGTSIEMLAGGFLLLVFGTLMGDWQRLNLTNITLNSGLGLGYLVVAGSLIGFGVYTWILRTAPISLVSTYAFVNPLLAIILGNLLANEPLTPRLVTATIVIVCSVALITIKKRSS
jgi:drug/metabolite transporter (DMT)-like permease